MIFSKNKPSPFSTYEVEKVRVINQTQDTILAEEAVIADTFFSRLKGLLGESGLPTHSALIFKPCDSIHTFFMRFPIDAAFVDKNNRVIRLYHSLKPWRLSGIHLNSAFCIELPAATLSSTHTQEDDQIKMVHL